MALCKEARGNNNNCGNKAAGSANNCCEIDLRTCDLTTKKEPRDRADTRKGKMREKRKHRE